MTTKYYEKLGWYEEIIDGESVFLPSPNYRHSKASINIGGKIGDPFDNSHGGGGPGGWWILTEIDVKFGEHTLRPDLSGWRRERITKFKDMPIPVIPDWVCEILSDGTEVHDRTTKKEIYRACGVGWYWIVDPLKRLVEIYQLEEGQWKFLWILYGKEKQRLPPFEQIEIDVDRLFLPRDAE